MMKLPLLESQFVYTPERFDLVHISTEPEVLIPTRALAPGEQYRFHFDMTRCIGCKCCVVACNEQNGNPAAIQWRRVGELEGGYFPNTRRYHLSMGCNHCLEPSCMAGCPVEAYTKDPQTGVVLHDPETCIGCQYCTWNCSYGVPQYNPERGVVGKCDLCHNRLSEGSAPACVAACPERAIQVEIVNIEEWRDDYLAANAPGLPSADDSVSSTRITLPEELPPDTGRVDTQLVHPEAPHYPLVFMLVLTQMSVGAFASLWMLDAVGRGAQLWATAVGSLAVAAISLGASTLHLGRPIYAFRALRGLRRSWLSREILGLSLFAAIASAFSAMLLVNAPARSVVGLLTAFIGVLGITCSARIYMVPARPAWNGISTMAEFFSTALLLGPLFVEAIGAGTSPWVRLAAVAGGTTQLFTAAVKFFRLARSEQFELRASAMLLSGRFQTHFLIRLGLLITAGIVLPLLGLSVPALLMALFGELLGRWLFFVSVVPKSMAAAFTRPGRSAA